MDVSLDRIRFRAYNSEYTEPLQALRTVTKPLDQATDRVAVESTLSQNEREA